MYNGSKTAYRKDTWTKQFEPEHEAKPVWLVTMKQRKNQREENAKQIVAIAGQCQAVNTCLETDLAVAVKNDFGLLPHAGTLRQLQQKSLQ